MLFLLLLMVFSVNALCEQLNETECIENYQQGYQTSPQCNSMFFCYPTYENETFEKCEIQTRTDFSSCTESLSICYNDIAVDTTKSRSCMCGRGIEFMKIDSCGIEKNWSGECISIETCTSETRTYLGREVEVYNNCQIIEHGNVDCSQIEIKEICVNNNLFRRIETTYKPDECNFSCVVDRISIIEEIECNCENNECVQRTRPITIPEREQEVQETKEEEIIVEDIINESEDIIVIEEEIKIEKNISEENIIESTNMEFIEKTILIVVAILTFIALLHLILTKGFRRRLKILR